MKLAIMFTSWQKNIWFWSDCKFLWSNRKEMSVECREIVDSIKEPAKCQDCDDLQKEFAKNPGGKPMNRKGLVIAAITG